MKCPECQTENPETRKFCRECGAKLLIICPECDFKNFPGDKFCGECGHELKKLREAPRIDFSQPQSYTPKFLADKILNNRSSLEGERKLVTVLFADVANYTSIAEKLDPEEVHQIMDGCFKILMDDIHKYEGTINQFTGDGVMALFGAPVAHEDHAQRACYAALAIQKAMGDYGEKIKEDRGIDFLMRIGVNSGLVVVGSIGDDLRMDYTAVGDTTNLAARMESMARPGNILVTKNTHKLAKDFFDFEYLGIVQVKGKEEPAEAYELLKASEVETRIEAAAAKGLTKFVGRRREMEALSEAFEKGRAGSGQVLGIVGEAGVGKSRLLLEIKNMLPQEEFLYLEGRCLHYGGSMAYLPILDILRSCLGIKEGDQAILIKKKMDEKVLQLDDRLQGALPPFQELLSLKVEDEAFLELEPQQKRERIFEATRDLLIRESQNKPLVIAIEDLQWIDKTSEEFLDYLIGWLANTHILLILLYRPEYSHQWGSKSYYSKIGVDQLSTRTSSELVQSILEGAEIAPELTDLILNRTTGNPLFMEELTHTLLENGSIEKKDNQYMLSRKVSGIQVPDTVQGIIAARMDRLEEGLKKIMQVASVIGREFAFRILQTITGMKDELKSHLLNLQGLEFIYEKTLFPELEYVFKHALTQEVAYNSLLIKRRKEIHGKIGGAIEELYPERHEEFYEMLAYHYSRSDDIEKSLKYLFKAGEKAKRNYANDAAISHFTRGLDLLNSLPETRERAKQELDFQTALGVPLIAIKGNAAQEVEATYARARELCEQIADNTQLFQVLVGLRRVYFARGELLRAHELGEQLQALSQDLGNSAHLSRALIMLAETLYCLGEFARVREKCKQVIRLTESERQRSQVLLYGTDVWGVSRIIEACALWHLGYPDQAVKMSNEGLARAQELSHPFNLAYAFFFSANVHQFRREVQVVRDRAEALIQYATEQGFPLWKAWGTFLHGWALVERGDRNEGIAQMSQALEDFSSMEISFFSTYSLALLAEARGKAGLVKEGLTVLGEAFERVDKSGEHLHEAELYRINGELLLMQGAAEPKVEGSFHQALGVARGQNAKALELRAAMSLSRLWQQQEKQEEAHQLLAEIYGWFTEGFDTADLKEAKILLEELA